MSAEDRLRDLLRNEASTLQPTGDGLARIQARIARRRRTRLWLIPSAAVATAAVAATFALVSPDTRKTQTLTPGSTPTGQSTTEPSAEPTTVLPDDGGTPLDYPAIWPFTTQAQASAWVGDHGSMPWADKGLEVGRRFVREHLGLTEVTVTQTCVSCDVLALSVSGTSVGELVLGRVGAGFSTGQGVRLFTVTAVRGADLTVTTPKAGTSVTSPLSVSGRITGADENVSLRLLSLAGDRLAAAGAPAGSEAPWSTTLSWSRQDWSYGSIVGVTYDGRGILNRVVAVPVQRGTAAATATFSGIVDGHVALFDAATGKQVRQLTFPPAGKSDTAATWSRDTLAWVRTSGASACANELNRLEGGKASTVAASTTVRYGWPQLDPLAERLAWVETPCAGGDGGHLVLTVNGVEVRRYPLPTGSVVNLLDVAADGELLLLTNDREATGPGTIGVLPADADSLERLRPLTPASSCYLAGGAAFDGPRTSVAIETCGSEVRVVRFGDDLKRTGQRPLGSDTPRSITIRDGAVLIWFSGPGDYDEIVRYYGDRYTDIISNTGCPTRSDKKGCVSAPDW